VVIVSTLLVFQLIAFCWHCLCHCDAVVNWSVGRSTVQQHSFPLRLCYFWVLIVVVGCCNVVENEQLPRGGSWTFSSVWHVKCHELSVMAAQCVLHSSCCMSNLFDFRDSFPATMVVLLSNYVLYIVEDCIWFRVRWQWIVSVVIDNPILTKTLKLLWSLNASWNSVLFVNEK